MQSNLKTFHNEHFTCPQCGWQRKGSELVTENISDEHWIFDFGCPECDQHIGSGQSPLIEEEESIQKEKEKWKHFNTILKLGGEGGSITFYSERDDKTWSNWYYYEVYDMGFEEEDIPPSRRKSGYGNTFWEALMLLYFEMPHFYRLHPLQISEQYSHDVISLLRLIRSQEKRDFDYLSWGKALEMNEEAMKMYIEYH